MEITPDDAEHAHRQAMLRNDLRRAGLPIAGTFAEDVDRAWSKLELEMAVDRAIAGWRQAHGLASMGALGHEMES